MKSAIRLALLGLALVVSTGNARADIVTFNGHTNTLFSGIGFSDGFAFTNSQNHFHFVTSSAAGAGPNNGTSFLLADFGGIILMSKAGGGSFNLLSADMSDWGANLQSNNMVVTGFLNGGGIIQANFNLDGNTSTFQNFAFEGFSNLTSVVFDLTTIGGDTFTLDNIEVSFGIAAVPAPSGVILASLGVAGVFGLRRRFREVASV